MADITSECGKQQDAAERRRCCQQSFLASVVGMQKEERRAVGRGRRVVGLILLAGVHTQMLVWTVLRSVTQPRYRPVARFQLRYFRDVMRAELRAKS